MPSIRKHFKRSAANTGTRVFIPDSKGEPTEEWIDVYGTASDSFQDAQKRMRSQVLDFMEQHGGPVEAQKHPEYQKFRDALTEELAIYLVKGWCFEEECTPANIKLLFEEGAHIKNLVDTTAGKPELFDSSLSNSSELMPNTSSPSISPPEKDPNCPEDQP